MIVDLSTNKAIKVFIFLITFLIFLLFFRNERNTLLITEYGLIELLSAFFYLVGIYICFKFIHTIKGLPKIYFSLWLILTVVFFGEETSYLQHYIGYDTPQFFLGNNAQQELNFHNITTTGGSLIDAINNNNFDLSMLLKSQNLFNIGFIFYFLALPISVLLSSHTKNIVSNFSIPVVGIRFVLCIWIPILFTIVIGFTDANNDTLIRNYMGESR
ncbi:MAG: hypothetical protein ACI8PW_000131, partial [Methylophilaceae bacterium]